MKKIFSILTTVGLLPTSTISTIACNNAKHKTNSTGNHAEQKAKEEQEKKAIKDGINDLLSNLDLEWSSIDAKSTYIEDKGSDFNITITNKTDDKGMNLKSYALSEDLTKSKRDEITKVNQWNTVEIKTAFAVSELHVPTNDELEKDSELKINNWPWSYGLLKFVDGTVKVKSKSDPLDRRYDNTLYWKVGYLSKESYYESLFNLGINYYFDSADYYDREEKRPYKVEKGFKFDDKWINDVILNQIAKGNEKFKQELMSLYESVKLIILKERQDDKGMWDEVVGKTWDSQKYPYSQRVKIVVSFISKRTEFVFIYLQPK